MSHEELDILIRLLQVLVAFTGLNVVALVVFGVKTISFFKRIEWRTNMMWNDFSQRTGISDGEAK